MTSKLEQLRAMPAQDMTTAPKVYAWEQQDGMTVSVVCRAVGIAVSTPVLDKAEAFKKKHGTLEGWSPAQATNVGVLIKKAVTAAMKEAGVEPHQLPQHVVELIYSDSLDRIGQGARPSVSQQINAHSVSMPRPTQWASAIRGRKTDSRNKAALSKLEDHPVMQTITRSGTDVAGIHNGTMSHSIKKIGEAFTLAQRVAQLEDALAAVVQHQQQQDARLARLEAGDTWKAVAERMRSEGAGYGAIAKLTGRSKSTISSYLTRKKD
ncbi:helix-turn-helix domain-containing protein [Pseudomonas sp. Z18(2022)]|uniref:helix-turn-helix domain-containing protein n=1 Tax=Pseudomonas sp. Z18(2022) TaxID=2983410 RepID=UPI002E803FF2|nr:helix-turn-helix domain-containing protein [Pseudomonas sp. Z18(2022)]